jgi:hypothetical protein
MNLQSVQTSSDRKHWRCQISHVPQKLVLQTADIKPVRCDRKRQNTEKGEV